MGDCSQLLIFLKDRRRVSSRDAEEYEAYDWVWAEYSQNVPTQTVLIGRLPPMFSSRDKSLPRKKTKKTMTKAKKKMRMMKN
jgi:hypothetical protein